jgi:hypothetical protein
MPQVTRAFCKAWWPAAVRVYNTASGIVININASIATITTASHAIKMRSNQHRHTLATHRFREKFGYTSSIVSTIKRTLIVISPSVETGTNCAKSIIYTAR